MQTKLAVLFDDTGDNLRRRIFAIYGVFESLRQAFAALTLIKPLDFEKVADFFQ
jgi:hypothetical protein